MAVLWQDFQWGLETKVITLAKPEIFGYWGLLSGGNYNPAELKGKTKPKFIFMSYGSKEETELMVS